VKKLHLDIDELHIDSFAVAEPILENETALNAITRGANTCYDCTRFGCPGTELC